AAGVESSDFYVARFTADGELDTSFSFDGRTTVDFDGGDDICTGLAVQPDGKIVIVGTSAPHLGSNGDFAIARLNSDGTLDTAGFGNGSGKSVVAFDLGGNNSDRPRRRVAPERPHRRGRLGQHGVQRNGLRDPATQHGRLARHR